MDERLPDPELLRQGGLRLASRVFIRSDIRGTAEQVRRFREFAQVTDPLADPVVAVFGERPEVRRLFETALYEGIDAVENAPVELENLFREVEATPYWLDYDRLERGAKAITRTGILGLFPLGDMSLMGGYLASRATKTLVATGEIEDLASRRLIETAAWWIDVTTPGNLRRGETGYASALRVRLVHAHVRAAMRRRRDWDYEAWDEPVNQVQMVGTLLLFSLVFVFGTQLLGIRYSERERADILHLWRYVGWLIGVDEQLLPAGEEDAWRLFWLLTVTEFIPDEDSKRLARALVRSHGQVGDGLLGKIVSQLSVRVHSSISRLVLGKKNADFLEIPNDPLTQAAVLTTAAMNFAAETARRHIPGATVVREFIGGLERRQYVGRLAKIFQLDRTYARHMRAA
ncbi:MAG TPA: oxygenase MpaB family protein [Amycolatopsis sp.]|uniref:oxygenase MpaB family protein n=1 Tax=Amycolatopsis sp. TaxID=37632 RepID=UPI002B46F135|nr:oxygenase MpaB family protein [Amycolatopsis sp.]HKS45461.1 oxygenase MpaB family protein [Amycolatopsis sp.]